MAYKSGDRVILIGKEGTWGTAVSPTKDVGIVQEAPLNIAKTLTKQFGLGTSEMTSIIQGKIEKSGSITSDFQHGRLLEYTFGTVAHDATDTPDIKHTFTFNEILPSFTLENGFNTTSDTVNTIEGCMAVSTRITCGGIDEPVRIGVDWMGEDVVTGTSASTAVISTLETLHGSQADFKIAETSADEVQNCEFVINRNTAGIFGLKNQSPQGMASKEFSIDFSATLGFKDKAEVDRILASTGFIIELDVSNETTLASGRRQLYIKLTSCQYATNDITGTLGDFTYIDITGSGTFDSCYNYDDIVEGSF